MNTKEYRKKEFEKISTVFLFSFYNVIINNGEFELTDDN